MNPPTSLVLNPKGLHYTAIKKSLDAGYEDNLWDEDALFLERNSRDFASRIERINTNAEAVSTLLLKHPKSPPLPIHPSPPPLTTFAAKRVYYPKFSPTRPFYDACRCPDGGYGGLLSVTFFSMEDAVRFFDVIGTAKGPSLGTNFTLVSPYTILAHYGELEWAAQYGVEAGLVRISIGLEDAEALMGTFGRALEALG